MTIYELMKKLMQYPADAKADYKIIIGTDNGCDTLLYEEPIDKKEYEELPVDWNNVAVDTPILVRDHKENAWKKKIFCKIRERNSVRMEMRNNILERMQE